MNAPDWCILRQEFASEVLVRYNGDRGILRRGRIPRNRKVKGAPSLGHFTAKAVGRELPSWTRSTNPDQSSLLWNFGYGPTFSCGTPQHHGGTYCIF
jgi:hypothetical protein